MNLLWFYNHYSGQQAERMANFEIPFPHNDVERFQFNGNGVLWTTQTNAFCLQIKQHP